MSKEFTEKNPEDFTAEQVARECMDSQGYVLMVGIITNKKDAAGFAIIDFKYRRHHFPNSDVKKVIENFEKFHRADEDDE